MTGNELLPGIPNDILLIITTFLNLYSVVYNRFQNQKIGKLQINDLLITSLTDQYNAMKALQDRQRQENHDLRIENERLKGENAVLKAVQEQGKQPLAIHKDVL